MASAWMPVASGYFSQMVFNQYNLGRCYELFIQGFHLFNLSRYSTIPTHDGH
jgi:hypothetical protein